MAVVRLCHFSMSWIVSGSLSSPEEVDESLSEEAGDHDILTQDVFDNVDEFKSHAAA